MGSRRRVPSPVIAGNPDTTTVAVKRSDDRPTSVLPRAPGRTLVRVGDRFNDPWMRAMIVSPSAQALS